MTTRRTPHLRALLATASVACALAAPAAASAMPIDSGRPSLHAAPSAPAAEPQVRTVVLSRDEALPIVVAGAALLVAMASAGYSVLRVARVRREVLMLNRGR
jgi:hypothetical protein